MQDEAAGKIEKPRPKGYAAFSWNHDCIAPYRRSQRLTIHGDRLERIRVDVEDMIAVIVIHDGPLLDGAERNALIDAIRIETPATDLERKLLIVGSRLKNPLIFRLVRKYRRRRGLRPAWR